MKHTRLVVLLCLILTVLLAAAALTGCAKKGNDKTPSTVSDTAPAASELGEGKLSFRFDVQNSAGETSSYLIHTDAATVGEALTALDLVEGEQGDYGLYVKTVCGETLDYNTDGSYWAFYENGEYAMTGVDATAITDGAVYAMVATKG